MRHTVSDDKANKASAHMRMVLSYMQFLWKMELSDEEYVPMVWQIAIDHSIFRLEIGANDNWKISRVR